MSELKFKGTQGNRELVFISGCCVGVGVKLKNGFFEMISNTILPDTTEEYEKSKAEIIANAKLEAAAPDLLKACQKILETDYGCAPSAGYMDELKKVCETAVKKALE